MNPLQEIPDRVRTWIYLGYDLAGLVLGSIAAYFTAVGEIAPKWVGGVSAVLVVIGSGFGFTAASNVYRPTARNRPGDL